MQTISAYTWAMDNEPNVSPNLETQWCHLILHMYSISKDKWLTSLLSASLLEDKMSQKKLYIMDLKIHLQVKQESQMKVLL